ncbi:MAG: hypothetical protein ABFD89_17800 [Bryobacteraceae bacterium]
MNDTRDTDTTELGNEVPSQRMPPIDPLPAISAIPDAVLQNIFDQLRGIQADMASERPPKWAQKLFDDLQKAAATNSTLERKLESTISRLQRLPCWAATREVECLLEALEGGKAE